MCFKNYAKMSDEELARQEQFVREDIAEHEHNLATVKSLIFVLGTKYSLKLCKQELHKIEAEKCYRQLNK
jgi:hypothetical protein